jgi:uncharacterized oxidoreductase
MLGNTILITGGGSGIGKALGHRLHDLGNTVIVAGRRREMLDEAIAGRSQMYGATFDVDNAQSIADFARQLIVDHPTLNVLVNNAGIMRFEDVTRGRDLADAEATVTTNLLGPIRLIDAFIDHLSTRPDAVIVNVTSGLAFVPLSMVATYSATKAAVHSYTVALREVLKGKIEVIEIAPPGVQTDLTPGQATRSTAQPLDEFGDEVISLLSIQPTPPEIIVQRAKFTRQAEAEGRFDQTLTAMNDPARLAR